MTDDVNFPTDLNEKAEPITPWGVSVETLEKHVLIQVYERDKEGISDKRPSTYMGRLQGWSIVNEGKTMHFGLFGFMSSKVDLEKYYVEIYVLEEESYGGRGDKSPGQSFVVPRATSGKGPRVRFVSQSRKRKAQK
jgi:hypothetical protein